MATQTPMPYQISGVLMVMSGCFNGFISLIWVGMLIWFCVGVLWFVPMAVACLEILFGALAIAGVRVPGIQVVSILGAVNSVFLFNMWGGIMEGIAAVLQFQPQVTAYIARRDELDG